MSVVNNVLLGADVVDGAFAFVDPLVVPFGPKGPTIPGRTFPPVMFPAGGQGFPPVVTLGHPTVSFP